MSLNSLQDDMSRRAASMAAMAKRATNPQQIEAIQKSLVAGVQSGAIQPYVGIPLIQELTKKITEVKAKMAQSMAGAGMQQPPQDQQAPQPPIAQQVMAQAAQADQSQGVEALRSNLPQSYAGGGIIAFEDGGQVERYQSGGNTPISRWWGGIKENFNEANEAAKLRNKLQMQYGPASAVPGLFMTQTDEERQAAKAVASALPNLSFAQLQQLAAEGPSALTGFNKPATSAATPYDPATATRRSMFEGQAQPPAPAAPAAPSAIPGGGGFKMPTLPTMKETPPPTLTDYNTLIGDMPAKTKAASETAVKAAQSELEGFDKPGFESREGRLGQREAGLERDSAIGRALTGIKTGLRIAGSKERTLAGALGNEGSQGIEDLIRGEAANRAAKDRLEDARDNLEQQKVAAKKGNYQAAQAAGKDAANDLRAGMQLTMTGAHYGNTEALNRYQTQQQGEFQRTSLGQSGILGLEQIRAQRDATSAQLQLGTQRMNLLKGQIAAGNERAKALMAQAETKAASAWQSSPQYRTVQQQAAKMAPIEAQRFMQQSWLQYKDNMLPSLMGSSDMGIPSFNEMYKATE